MSFFKCNSRRNLLQKFTVDIFCKSILSVANVNHAASILIHQVEMPGNLAHVLIQGTYFTECILFDNYIKRLCQQRQENPLTFWIAKFLQLLSLF